MLSQTAGSAGDGPQLSGPAANTAPTHGAPRRTAARAHGTSHDPLGVIAQASTYHDAGWRRRLTER